MNKIKNIIKIYKKGFQSVGFLAGIILSVLVSILLLSLSSPFWFSSKVQEYLEYIVDSINDWWRANI